MNRLQLQCCPATLNIPECPVLGSICLMPLKTVDYPHAPLACWSGYIRSQLAGWHTLRQEAPVSIDPVQ